MEENNLEVCEKQSTIEKLIGKHFSLKVAFVIYVFYVAKTWNEICSSKGYFWEIPDQILLIGGTLLSAALGANGITTIYEKLTKKG